MKNKRQTGFTMLELLVVLVILGLITGIVGPQFFGKAEESRVDTAEVQIKMLKMALQTYRLDMGQFPETLASLQNKPGTDNAQQWRGPYLSDDLPLDPWNRDYQYARDSGAPQGFYLYSLGADGKEGGNDLDADIGYVPAAN